MNKFKVSGHAVLMSQKCGKKNPLVADARSRCTPQTYTWWEGLAAPPKNHTSAFRPSGVVFRPFGSCSTQCRRYACTRKLA